jgi:conjugal transfer mating pair stabilization protein TraN
MCSKTEVQPATAQYACQAGYSLSGTICSRSDPAIPSYSCPTGYVRTDTTCTQNLSQPATMTLVCPEGTSVQDGTCYGETAGQSDCQELEQNTQCTWLRDTCLDESQNGPCKVTERTFQCPVPGEPAKENKEYVCSGDLYCLNGSCQTIEREASNDFKDALVAMGAIDQTEKEFDPDKLGLFKGTRETCHKPVFGLVNCCAGKVSGLLSGGAAYAASLANAPVLLTAVATQFLTVFLCSKEEKMLDVKDRLGLCHFVGSYCSASFLGVCTTKKKAYCCFESKLTRILQEQGRPQINKPWAKPKEEKCEGFTVDEFSRLDMSKMDFSEIYSEFLEAAKLPNEAQMATDIQAKIQQYYQQNAPGGT